ncbi:rRNA pseudouridine synthase [candidate division TA06 bacterium]|nr:rRNA pseudouridine synthase [candidate division TA06 bacterium]
MNMEQKVRLNKFLAQCGVASRRQADEMIAAGQVTVNGKKVTELGTVILPSRSTVKVGGKHINPPKVHQYWVFNKPKGYLCSRGDPYGRPTIYDAVPFYLKNMKYAGRLDLDSEGLLIMTDDGELIEQITHPSNQIKRTYVVWVRGLVQKAELDQLKQGVEYEGEHYAPAPAKILRYDPREQNSFIEITIREGKKREVKMMFRALGRQVLELKRISFGPVKLGYLETGQARKITDEELAQMKRGRKK